MAAFTAAGIGDRFVWDATGRINILHRMSDDMLDHLRRNGCREVVLGIESGSERLLTYMGKRITPEMTRSVVRRLTERGISVKGYFILGFPTEKTAPPAWSCRTPSPPGHRLIILMHRVAEQNPLAF